MTNDTVPVRVRVRDSAGAYTATIGRCRASSTADAETAVRRAVEKFVHDDDLLVMRGAPRLLERLPDGIQMWEVTLGERSFTPERRP